MSGNKALQKITVYLSSETVSKLNFLVEQKRHQLKVLLKEEPENNDYVFEEAKSLTVSGQVRNILAEWLEQNRDLFILKEVRRKGQGAEYGKEIRELSFTHRQILMILLKQGSLTKQKITTIMNENKEENEPYIGGFSVSGRLSELLGLGYVSMKYAEVEVYDPRTMQFRFRKKPIWNITSEGIEALKKPVGLRTFM